MTLIYEGTFSNEKGRLLSCLDRTNGIIRHLNCDANGNIKIALV